ncbi:MAG: hypothetical protein ACXABY_01655 [Candidatus Thorarchaeota archaeon]|jgi:hypothetical protein
MEDIHQDADKAIQTLLPSIKQVIARLKRHGDNPMNHLVIKPGWERDYVGKFPQNYQDRVGNMCFIYAVEDRTKHGPHHLRFKVRVLSVSYVDVEEAERAASSGGMYVQDTPMHIPQKISRVVANGFFIGPVEEIKDEDTGDWTYLQIFHKKDASVLTVPYEGLIVPR